MNDVIADSQALPAGDVPLERINADFAKFYAGWGDDLKSADFDRDVVKETRI